MGSHNTNMKGRPRAALACMIAAATLMGGSLVAPAAYAGGGDWGVPGPGGPGQAQQAWWYRDGALSNPDDPTSGSYGPASDPDSLKKAFESTDVKVGFTDAGFEKAKGVLSTANANCVAGFKARHPGEGDGDCRLVAVGAAINVSAGLVYDGTDSQPTTSKVSDRKPLNGD